MCRGSHPSATTLTPAGGGAGHLFRGARRANRGERGRMAVATSGQPHIDAAAVGVPTVASLARDWARRTPHHVAMREKDFGIWREFSWDDDLEPRARRRPRAARPRRRHRRPGVDPRRGPSRVGVRRPRHRRRPRHHRRPLPDQPRRRGRVPADRLRRRRPPRRGPGAGGQGAGHGRRPADDHLRRAARDARLRGRPAAVLGRSSSSAAGATVPSTPARSSGGWTRPRPTT